MSASSLAITNGNHRWWGLTGKVLCCWEKSQKLASTAAAVTGPQDAI